MVNQAYSY